MRMVQGMDIVQVEVVFLTYDPDREGRTYINLNNTCTVDFTELKRHEEMKRRQKSAMGSEAYRHYKWYNRSLQNELRLAESGCKLKIVHWDIASANLSAFRIKDIFYKAISIIIGPNMEYWYAAFSTLNGDSKQGSRQRNVSLPPETAGEHQRIPTELPTYIQCRRDYCANNCDKCIINYQRLRHCACYIEKRYSRIPEETAGELEVEQESGIVIHTRPILTEKIATEKHTTSKTLNTIDEE